MMTAVILAGGLGTRLREMVPDLPKPMAPINGRPFLAHQMDYWIGQGIGRFVLSVGYLHEAISGHFGTDYHGLPIDYVVEHSPLGTGGGLLLAAERLAGEATLLLLNGDTYFEVELDALRAKHENSQADWTLALFRPTEAGRYMGTDIAREGRITSLNSGTAKPNRLANGGVYLVNPGALRLGGWRPGDKHSLEDEILPAALATDQRLYGLECVGIFIDIGVPEDYAPVPNLLAA